MAEELIRLDTTIIGIDTLINKAETAAEANGLCKAKDIIYSQQRYFADVQSVKRGKWIPCGRLEGKIVEKCSECEQGITSKFAPLYHYCPNCGAKMATE